jgi:hypothetical protein
MPEFRSYRSYWNFADSVRNHRRFTRSPDQMEFLETILATSTDKEERVAADVILWRAQLGHDWEEREVAENVTDEWPCPHPAKRMKPLRGRALEGRANPKGIPFLY